MKKYLGLAALVLVVAVLVGVYGKKLVNRSDNINQEQNQTNNQTAGNQEQNQGQVNNQAAEIVNPSGLYSINELFTMNKPMKCTWKESLTEGREVTNILYISGKKFYQDVTMGDIGHVYTVSNGEYLYIWNDFSGVASKMKFTEITTSAEPGQGEPKSAAGLDQKRDFICERWSVDASLFNPPQGKNFQDITEEMQQVTQELKESDLEKAKQQSCDLCQTVSDQEIKDMCLKNAQCGQ